MPVQNNRVHRVMRFRQATRAAILIKRKLCVNLITNN